MTGIARSLPCPRVPVRFSLERVRFDSYSFGEIVIDGISYDHDVLIDRGTISKRHKKKSKQHRSQFGHTPLSADETLPWSCRRLVVGTGAAGSLPIMDEVRREADRRGVELVALPTEAAIDLLGESSGDTNAVLHVTC